jgi:protein-tyrosine phosphatase
MGLSVASSRFQAEAHNLRPHLLPCDLQHATCLPTYLRRMKILMVCLGNICRSPLAQGILEHKIKQAGLDWTVDSAGTGDWHVGEPPHRLSQKVAKLNGVDICGQSARQFRKEDMELFDKIYVMDKSNYANVKEMSGEYWNENKVDLFLNELFPGDNRDVPDPWYGEEDGYHEVYKLIAKTCDKIIEKYREVKIQK